MLSEPFHRLIVNDEEDEVREARPLGSTAPERHAQITNDAEMKTVAEEDENAGDWWEEDPARDFTFEFEIHPHSPKYGHAAPLRHTRQTAWSSQVRGN